MDDNQAAKKIISTKEQVHLMRKRMQENKEDDVGSVWDSLWKENVTPWDLGGPTPVLMSEIRKHDRKMNTVLVPGCGSGHDLIALARYMDESSSSRNDDDANLHPQSIVVGMDISLHSLETAQQVIMKEEEERFAKHEVDDPTPTSRTPIVLYHGDFCASPDTWSPVFDTHHQHNNNNNMPKKLSKQIQFDFILDYLFFCAIPPDLRSSWGRQMSQLLANNHGNLLTLIFPHSTATDKKKNKKPLVVGPPYFVSFEDYNNVLREHGLYLQSQEPYASPHTVPARQGQELVGWWSKQTKSL